MKNCLLVYWQKNMNMLRMPDTLRVVMIQINYLRDMRIFKTVRIMK